VFLAILQVLQCAFLIFQVFEFFSAYFKSYSVCFSLSMNLCFLAILQVLQCTFLFSKFLSISCHIPGQTVSFLSHFPRFLSIPAIFQVLQCSFLISHSFQCSSPYFTSYSVCFSFSMFFFQFSRHTLGPTLCISHF
jgi:hypothetical protein